MRAFILILLISLSGCAIANQAELEEGLRKCGDDETCRRNQLVLFEIKEQRRREVGAAVGAAMQEYSQRQHELAVARASQPVYRPTTTTCNRIGNTINCQSY